MTVEFEDATNKKKQDARNLEELTQMVRYVKNLNIPLAKPLLDLHVNISYHIKQLNKAVDWDKCYKLERRILYRDWEKPSDMLTRIETKIARQVPIELVLRLLVLFSVSLSGIKEKEFDSVRRALVQNYGYQEATTLSNLNTAGLVKKADKELNWEEISEVRFTNK